MTTTSGSTSIRPTAEDFLQIVDALYRFGAGQDRTDRALFESAFTVDATLDFTEPARRFGRSLAPFHGRTAIADTILTTLANLRTTHTVTNPRVTVDGDRADLWALVEAQHVLRDDDTRHLLLKNIYTVDLVRNEQEWLIRQMTIENVWFSGDPVVLFPVPDEGTDRRA
jgi:hypothetical protein